ncbi:MAG: 3-deoxy-D-manno-octulosonic acid transferase [Thermodesulfobacteriota bacterium]|nr:3-deoxy-D-manno-octulosonic acid transferase [Thermodesulfobacteriota bacterium]
MLLIYNILQISALILLGPFLVVGILLIPKYRGRILKRLGIGSDLFPDTGSTHRPRIWIHALSVGEVTSARPLVRDMRKAFPHAMILFSASTRSGGETAVRILDDYVDRFFPFPLDFFPSVRRFVKRINPDLFILVETDFWPNFLFELKMKGIPGLLVNGRISKKSFDKYNGKKWFFSPMFNSFSFLCMQTESDAQKMVGLGVDVEKVRTFGNLKYDSVEPGAEERNGKSCSKNAVRADGPANLGIPASRTFWVAGSTHAGEEEILFNVFKRVRQEFPALFLVVAPRNVDRGDEILRIADKTGLAGCLRSKGSVAAYADFLILDTLGELIKFYSICDMAFVGGSLADEGGHNPLEPACFAKPVMFGPHMDDFDEISKDLLDAGGAVRVCNEDEIYTHLQSWLADRSLMEETGVRAETFVNRHRGVTARHIELIRSILNERHE